MIFNFSLYTVPLLIILVTYFRMEFRELSKKKQQESSEVYRYQYWKWMLVLVDFQDK